MAMSGAMRIKPLILRARSKRPANANGARHENIVAMQIGQAFVPMPMIRRRNILRGSVVAGANRATQHLKQPVAEVDIPSSHSI